MYTPENQLIIEQLDEVETYATQIGNSMQHGLGVNEGVRLAGMRELELAFDTLRAAVPTHSPREKRKGPIAEALEVPKTDAA